MTVQELFETVEYKEDDVNKPEEVAQHTGAMIALRPRQDHIDRLALADGEAPEELHTTILFLGKASDYSYDTRARIINAMREVALRHRFVTANGFGINSWNAQGETPCIVLGVSGSEMVDIYNGIVGALQGFDLLQVPKQHEPWQPHITLKYTDDFSEVPDLVDLQGEVVYDAIRVAFGGIVDDIPLQPAVSSNDGYVSGNRYENVPQGGMKTQQIPIRETPADIEEKVIRRVRTAAGVRRYGQPVGSVIVGGDSPLKHVKTEKSEYEGYEKYSVGSKPFYTRKEGGQYVAYDEEDRVITRKKTEEEVLRQFEDLVERGKKLPASKGKETGVSEDDTPGGLKKVESDYDDYDKFIGQNGKPVYRWHGDGKFYDENDEPVDINDYNGEKRKAELIGAAPRSDKKPAEGDDGKKPLVVNVKPTGQTHTLSPAALRKIEKMKAAGKKPGGSAGGSSDPRSGLPVTPDGSEELDAVLDKVQNSKGKTIPSEVINEIRALAHRQRDVRNKRKLMLYAQQLSEQKVFASLCVMDPWLRASALEVKLITPGGRVGTDATLNRSRRRNWVENSPMKRLPKYIRIVANGLLKNGHSVSRAIALAVAAVKRWARGGDNVRPKVQAAAAAAVAQWEALKASA